MAPFGLILAAMGVGLTGVVPSYPPCSALLLLSGLGRGDVPPRRRAGTRAWRRIDSATAMSLFAAGGSVGFFLAPAWPRRRWTRGAGRAGAVHPARGADGVRALDHQRRHRRADDERPPRRGIDRPRMFALLIAVEVARSCISFGINTSSRCTGSRSSARPAPSAAPRSRSGWPAASAARCSAGGSPTGSASRAPCSSATPAARRRFASLLLVHDRVRRAAVHRAARPDDEHPARRAGQARPGLPARAARAPPRA